MNNTPKRDRQGSRTVSDLERRSVQRFSEVLGIAEKARDTANEAAEEYDNLDHNEVFKRLTKNETLQGLFRKPGSDELYVNADYIQAGTIKGEMIDGKNLKISGGSEIAGWIIENVNIEASGIAYSGVAMHASRISDTNDAEIALTPFGVYLYGTDGTGLPYARHASWGQIISAAGGI